MSYNSSVSVMFSDIGTIEFKHWMIINVHNNHEWKSHNESICTSVQKWRSLFNVESIKSAVDAAALDQLLQVTRFLTAPRSRRGNTPSPCRALSNCSDCSSRWRCFTLSGFCCCSFSCAAEGCLVISFTKTKEATLSLTLSWYIQICSATVAWHSVSAASFSSQSRF